MIIRIVKMTFRENMLSEFETIFKTMQPQIGEFDGCLRVAILRDIDNPGTYFTISNWASVQALENYRSSDFFKNTWAMVKPMFAERAEAWSLAQPDNGL